MVKHLPPGDVCGTRQILSQTFTLTSRRVVDFYQIHSFSPHFVSLASTQTFSSFSRRCKNPKDETSSAFVFFHQVTCPHHKPSSSSSATKSHQMVQYSIFNRSMAATSPDPESRLSLWAEFCGNQQCPFHHSGWGITGERGWGGGRQTEQAAHYVHDWRCSNHLTNISNSKDKKIN